MELTFAGEIWFWRGPAPWHFVTVPADESAAIEAVAALVTYGWGMVPVTVRIGDSEWTTSLWPKDGGYIVPIKAWVRAAEQLEVGDAVEVRLTVAAAPQRESIARMPRRASLTAAARSDASPQELLIVARELDARRRATGSARLRIARRVRPRAASPPVSATIARRRIEVDLPRDEQHRSREFGQAARVAAGSKAPSAANTAAASSLRWRSSAARCACAAASHRP